jgi:nucleotide-binding universal stress UspA family protein
MEVEMSGSGVIVGTDGSTVALRAVEWAAREAALRRVRLRIVSVPEQWPYHERPGKTAGELVASTVSAADRAAAERAVEAARGRAADLAPGLSIDTSVPDGSPADELIASAAGERMLVVGSRGSGGFSGLVLGSMSRYLATHAPVPVVVTREDTPAARGEIVVGTRRTRQAEAAVQFAFEEAELHGADLVAVEALPGRLAALADVDGELLTVIARQLEADLAGRRAEYPSVKIRAEVVQAHPGRVLMAASARASLVVLGRHGGHSQLLGTVHAVLGHAHGPVAVVPAGYDSRAA